MDSDSALHGTENVAQYARRGAARRETVGALQCETVGAPQCETMDPGLRETVDVVRYGISDAARCVKRCAVGSRLRGPVRETPASR